jgi:enterochelin esterase-like enzyme
MNDGQDLPRMGMEQLLVDWYGASNNRLPFLMAGIYAGPDRMREYGVAAQPDYMGRGDLAGVYSLFVLNELIPFLRSRYSITGEVTQVWMAGFSLGALSALDLVWSHPGTFGGAGVFSGALWWRSKAFSAVEPDANRIMHDQIKLKAGEGTSFQRFWWMAGTEEETDDRNKNGIIDVIDDTLDCIQAMESVGVPKEHLRYLQVEGGRHDPESWGACMLDFWDFMLKK